MNGSMLWRVARPPSTANHARRPGTVLGAAGRFLVLILLLTSCTVGAQEEREEGEPRTGTQRAGAGSAIVISRGGTYSGRWESDDPNVPAVSIRTSEPVVLEDSLVRGPGDLIYAEQGFFSDVVVRNVRGEGVPPQEAGRLPGRFLHVDTYTRVVVEDSVVEGTSGIYLYESQDGATVRIVGNRARNIDGRRSDGAGGHDGAEFVQFVQLNRGRGLRDSRIAWNEVVNEPGHSRVEDVISLYDTFGRADDPVRVQDNLIHGAYAADAIGDAYTGGGIMLGDQGGGFLHAHDNTVVATSNYGIAISGGHDNVIRDNVVVSCGRLDDGSPIASRNVGIYIWNHAQSPRFEDNVGVGNTVAWQGTDARNDWWVPDADAWEDNVVLHPGDAVPCEVEEEAIARWRSERELMLAEGRD